MNWKQGNDDCQDGQRSFFLLFDHAEEERDAYQFGVLKIIKWQ